MNNSGWLVIEYISGCDVTKIIITIQEFGRQHLIGILLTSENQAR